MLQRLLSFIRSRKDIVIYIIFGALTTAVNYVVYFPLYNFTAISAVLCNCIAWFVSVCFAFLTNKPFVFQSHDWSANVLLSEFLKFMGCRVLSGVLESVIIMITVDILSWNGNIWKLVTGLLVVILNYFGSKFFVFRNKKGTA